MTTNPLWQDKATALVGWAEQNLARHDVALSYLRECGLSNATITVARLGFIPNDITRRKQDWGLEEDGKNIWLPRGIVYPCFYGGRLWYAKIWRDDEGKSRFINVSGSTITGALYGGDTIAAHTVLVEGESTALFIQSQLGIAAVSLGGSCNNLPTGKALDDLLSVPHLTIFYNNHEPGQEWADWIQRDYLPHARILRPSWPHRTVVEAWRDGAPVVAWLREQLNRD